MIQRLVAIALLICFTAVPAAAQTSATLVGVVQDAQGGRLPGVSVRIRQTETGVARDVITDSEGRFNAAALSAGEYELRAVARRLPAAGADRACGSPSARAPR